MFNYIANIAKNHWPINYIDLPYKTGTFDCWDLVRKVYREQYGIELQAIPVEENNLRQLINVIESTKERSSWKRTVTPNEGDVVLLRQSRHPIHVGIWLKTDGGGVLHCIKDTGVVFQNLQSLTLSGWKIEGFYRYTVAKNK